MNVPRALKRMYSAAIGCVLCFITQSCPTLHDPMDCSLPSSSVHGILQARILEWVAMPSSRGSSQPRDGTQVSHIACRFFTVLSHQGKLLGFSSVQFSSVAQSCPTLSDPVDCSLPGSSTQGIFQARVVEWGAIAFSDKPP